LVLAQPAGQAPPAKPGSAAQPTPAAQPAPTSPVAKQPTIKSKEEQDAVMAMFQAIQGPDVDARIKACDAFQQKFANSEFRSIALFFMTVAYQDKGDYDKTLLYGEETLKLDPANFQAMLLLSQLIANRTRENDLDKEEKLKKAENYANQALEALKTAPRPNPAVTDEQWALAKRDLNAQAYAAFAMVALARKNYDSAIEQFQKSLAASPSPDPSTMVRLGDAQTKAGKYDDAIATFDKVAGMADVPPVVKQIAAKAKEGAVQAKAKAAK
jgi:tetratricopeptide (TPR) repeat protein